MPRDMTSYINSW